MKSPKNIETIIQEGEKNLSIQPSNRSWQRLERRLDHHAARRHRNGHVVVMRRWLAVAATLLVLVASVFVFSNRSQQGLPHEYLPEIVEVLGGNNDCSPYCMNIEARKRLPVYYVMPTKEGLKKES